MRQVEASTHRLHALGPARAFGMRSFEYTHVLAVELAAGVIPSDLAVEGLPEMPELLSVMEWQVIAGLSHLRRCRRCWDMIVRLLRM